ncbi:hypothetical protein [Prochlorococcus marinus]|uniref:hypothetical protein n=1 Tax=Prochlorococcus marinus TaxID=1219 RepID=UPI001ADBAA3B|nr:hypothetical protein [Prochlorococcus marinus]MBO8219546.1 hypothetical protein [Prochlorococcus marinus CUG1416]MBW3051917.1 hypothetical protein [Prochlorococcus marinus str. MU1416]
MLSNNNLAYQRIQGGFGNQLFQICAGIFIANVNRNKKLYVDCNDSIFSAKLSNNSKYLRLKKICKLIMLKEDFNKLNFPTTFITILNRLLLRTNSLFKKHYLNSLNNKDDYTLSTPFSYLITGYLQDYKYVEKTINKNSGDKFYGYYKNTFPFSPKDNSLLLHFRYYPKDGFSIKECVKPDFYKECINNIISKNIKYLYISTDCELSINAILTLLKLEDNNFKEVIDLRPLTQKMEVDELLTFLSTFPTILLSNSTFSWWIGYFASKFKGANVIAPSNKWLQEGYVHPWTDFPIKIDIFNWI